MRLGKIVGASFGAVLVAGMLWAADQAEKKLLCPLSGEAVNKDASADYKGGKVYFCCDGCKAKFEADTAKYATKANEQLVASGQAKQTACPLTGGTCKAATAIDVDGNKVCFCCNNCKGKVTAAEKDKQLELVFGDKAFAKGFKVAAAAK